MKFPIKYRKIAKQALLIKSNFNIGMVLSIE